MYAIFAFFLFFTLPSFAKDSVLYIGDSHTYGGFGDGLSEELEKVYTTTRIGSCGARAESYFNNYVTKCGLRWTSSNKDFKNIEATTPKLESLMETHPNHFIVALGTNYLGFSKSQLEKEIDKILSVIPQSTSCHWIGAPDIQSVENKSKITQINSIIEEKLKSSKCKFINIQNLENYPPTKGDGIHFSSKQGKLLGLKASKLILPSLEPLVPTTTKQIRTPRARKV